HWLPSHLYVGNYTKLLDQYPFLRWVANTLFVASTVTAVKLVIDSMAAYALARMEFPGRRVVLAAMAAAIMIPPALLIIPLFFLVRAAGLLDPYWALILPGLATPVGIFTLRAFVRGIPRELERAARIDSAGRWRIYRHIVLPSIRPGLVVVASYI